MFYLVSRWTLIMFCISGMWPTIAIYKWEFASTNIVYFSSKHKSWLVFPILHCHFPSIWLNNFNLEHIIMILWISQWALSCECLWVRQCDTELFYVNMVTFFRSTYIILHSKEDMPSLLILGSHNRGSCCWSNWAWCHDV